MSADDDPVAAMREAARTLRTAREDAAEVGESDLATVADAYDEVATVLDRHEDRATDRDDIQGYIDFRDALSDTLESLPADVLHAEAFVEANEAVTTRITSTLSASDFDEARSALSPAREAADRYESWRDARAAYRDARHRLVARRKELRARLDDLERVRRLGAADLDAPVDELRAPIEAYNDAVAEAVRTVRRETPSRDVVDWLATAEAYPLVDLPSPPDRLRDYLADADVGDEPVATLVEYAGYSRSKLDHYVADPERFRAVVATNETLLSGLDADPLSVPWPPAAAPRLRWRARELVAVVGRVAGDDVVARAREVRSLADRADYRRLRDAAVARAELTADQRDRLRRGVVAEEAASVRADHDRVVDCLDDHPPLDG